MRDSAEFGSLATPIVSERAPPDFDSLSPHDQRWVHFLLTSISLRPNFMTDYVFIETGWSHHLRFMTLNLWVAGTGSGLDRAYRLTENGAASLFRLDVERGPCETPPGREKQPGE